jgi:hypothetical protein
MIRPRCLNGLAFSRMDLIGCRRSRCLVGVDLGADTGQRLLVDGGGVPGLDRPQIGVARLVAGPRHPAMSPQEIRRRGERRRGVVEAARSAGQDVLRQELRVADLAVHRAARAG